MLKTRVIPTLLWDQMGLVKGVSFQSWRRVGIPLPAIQVYNQREVDELIFLDIRANQTQSAPDYATVRDLSSVCFVPLTVGGGISSMEHIRNILLAGADKVAINTACYENPELIRQAADYYGSQCIVVSIDAKKSEAGSYECYSHSGTKNQHRCPVDWAKQMEQLGAGEILVTSIERDGTMTGYDTELIRRIAEKVSIPVIASGGAGSSAHMLEAITVGHAHAVAAASMFHFTQLTPKEVKQFLKSSGVPVRVQ